MENITDIAYQYAKGICDTDKEREIFVRAFVIGVKYMGYKTNKFIDEMVFLKPQENENIK